MTKKSALIAALVAIVAVVAAYVAQRRNAASSDRGVVFMKASDANSTLKPLPPQAFASYDAVQGERLSLIVERASRDVDQIELSHEEAKEIAALTSAYLEAFSAGSRGEAVRLRKIQGLESSYLEEVSEKRWTQRSATLRDLAIDYDHVDVSPRMISGSPVVGQAPVNPVDHGKKFRTRSVGFVEPRGPRDVLHPDRVGADVLQVEVPCRAADEKSGVHFKGKLRLLLARRPDDGRWIAIGLELRYPEGAQIVLPLI